MWIKCSERLPEIDQNVLLYFADRSCDIWIAALTNYRDSSYPIVWMTQERGVLVRGWHDDEEPSHWMPLPAPPD